MLLKGNMAIRAPREKVRSFLTSRRQIGWRVRGGSKEMVFPSEAAG